MLLRSNSVIVLQKAAESLMTFDLPTSLPDFLARFDDLVAQPLMVSFSMEMVQVSVMARRNDVSPKKIILSRHSDLRLK